MYLLKPFHAASHPLFFSPLHVSPRANRRQPSLHGLGGGRVEKTGFKPWARGARPGQAVWEEVPGGPRRSQVRRT